MITKRIFASVLGAFALSLATTAGAATLVIDVSGIDSVDGRGDADNTVLSLDLGSGSTVTGIGWDVSITPAGASWYSEATVGITDSAFGQGIDLRPGIADEFGGDGIAGDYSSGGIVSLAGAGLSDIVLADGILLLEFFEFFDDVADVADASWGGSLTIEYTPVPLPGAAVLLFSGLLSAGFLGRRKS